MDPAVEIGGHIGPYGEHGARAHNGGLGAVPPAGSRSRAPGQEVGVKPPWSRTLFCVVICLKWRTAAMFELFMVISGNCSTNMCAFICYTSISGTAATVFLHGTSSLQPLYHIPFREAITTGHYNLHTDSSNPTVQIGSPESNLLH